jgi:hypothetical protein
MEMLQAKRTPEKMTWKRFKACQPLIFFYDSPGALEMKLEFFTRARNPLSLKPLQPARSF